MISLDSRFLGLAMPSTATLVLGLATFSVLIAKTSGSVNAGNYQCNAWSLAQDNICILEPTSKAPFSQVSRHSVDVNIGPDNYRRVYSESKNKYLSVSPVPLTNGDKLVYSDTAVVGDEWLYVQAFELTAPLRDYAMFVPEALINDPPLWSMLTKAFRDCNIKTADEYIIKNGRRVGVWSTDSVLALMKDPQGIDIKTYGVLRWLEEGIIDLVCLMVGGIPASGGYMDRCYGIAAANNIAVTTKSTCWQDAYDQMAWEDFTYTTELLSVNIPSDFVEPTPTTWEISWGLDTSAASITISPGDTVKWVWDQQPAAYHDVVSGPPNSPNGLFASALINSGDFSRTFDSAGEYPFYCTPHPFMAGTIKVLGGSSNSNSDLTDAPTPATTTTAAPSAAAAATTTSALDGTEVVAEGYLIDNLCIDQPWKLAPDDSNITHAPWDHTKFCSLLSWCKVTGYGLVQDLDGDGHWTVSYRLSTTANALYVNDFLSNENFAKAKDLFVSITGVISGSSDQYAYYDRANLYSTEADRPVPVIDVITIDFPADTPKTKPTVPTDAPTPDLTDAPTPVSCKDNGKLYPVGASWLSEGPDGMPDFCSGCDCLEDGSVVCWAASCAALPDCKSIINVEGECCGVCDDIVPTTAAPTSAPTAPPAELVVCDTLKKSTCKKTDGCAYKSENDSCLDESLISVCDGLKKKKCKKQEGCGYASSDICLDENLISVCDGLKKKKCKKQDGCAYASSDICLDEGLISVCDGLKKKKCKKQDVCEYVSSTCVEETLAPTATVAE